MKKILFLLLFISSLANGQSVEELFSKANTFYKQGNLEMAIENYLEIDKQEEVSSELYYNLGNCYYKLNNVAETIYYYEKALKLNPLNEDARNNLVFAKRLTIDSIKELPKSILQKINKNYFQKLSYNQWALITIVFSFLTAILFLLFYFSFRSSLKRTYFIASVFSFLFFISALTITYNQFIFTKNEVFAIIFSEKTEIRNEPSISSESIFTLHEGTKVRVLDAVGNWRKIKLVDGKVGWIPLKELKLLSFF